LIENRCEKCSLHRCHLLMKIVRFRGRLIAAATLSLVVLFAIVRTYSNVDLVENDDNGRDEFVGGKYVSSTFNHALTDACFIFSTLF